MWEGDGWVALKATRAAADIVQTGFFEPLHTELKSAVDPVTQVDRDAENVIRRIIGGHFPSDEILGEEEGAVTGEQGESRSSILSTAPWTTSTESHLWLFQWPFGRTGHQ